MRRTDAEEWTACMLWLSAACTCAWVQGILLAALWPYLGIALSSALGIATFLCWRRCGQSAGELLARAAEARRRGREVRAIRSAPRSRRSREATP